jgi:hypothetical protein
MDPGPFNGGRDPYERSRFDGNRMIQHDRVRRLVRGDKGNGQTGNVALLATEAGPERRVERGGNLAFRRQRRQVGFAPGPCVSKVMREMRENRRCNPARRDVRKVSQRNWGG